MKYTYPKGLSFITTYQRAFKLVRDPLKVIGQNVARFGDSYSVFLTPKRRLILTQDAEFIDYVLKKNHRHYNKSEMVTHHLGKFIGNGLLTSNGAYWLRQRRLIQPGFHIQKIQSLYAIMKKTIDEFLLQFPVGQDVDIYPQMNRLAFEIVIHTLFDIDLPRQTMDELSRFISEVQEFVIKDIRQPYWRWWFSLSGEVKVNMKKSERAREILTEIIRKRKASDKKFNDLLDMLLDSRYEDNGEPMTEDQVLDEILILIIAGHETTANVLTWALYLLAKHPDELTRLRETTKNITITECVTHERLLAVINESMRLYPPAYASDRVALEDDHFKSYTYPRGTIVVLYFYGLHRSERYWKDADQFKPDRFVLADKEALKAFYPFGGGPRLCIGNNFAMAEMALFLQAFAQRFDLQPTSHIPGLKPLLTLRPEGVLIDVQKIQGS